MLYYICACGSTHTDQDACVGAEDFSGEAGDAGVQADGLVGAGALQSGVQLRFIQGGGIVSGPELSCKGLSRHEKKHGASHLPQHPPPFQTLAAPPRLPEAQGGPGRCDPSPPAPPPSRPPQPPSPGPARGGPVYIFDNMWCGVLRRVGVSPPPRPPAAHRTQWHVRTNPRHPGSYTAYPRTASSLALRGCPSRGAAGGEAAAVVATVIVAERAATKAETPLPAGGRCLVAWRAASVGIMPASSCACVCYVLCCGSLSIHHRSAAHCAQHTGKHWYTNPANRPRWLVARACMFARHFFCRPPNRPAGFPKTASKTCHVLQKKRGRGNFFPRNLPSTGGPVPR